MGNGNSYMKRLTTDNGQWQFIHERLKSLGLYTKVFMITKGSWATGLIYERVHQKF